jgi:hypothetical protein
MSVVHQELLGDMRATRSQLGPSQCGTEERKVHTRIVLALLQQEKHHTKGQRQINYHILQEGTQGLVLDPKAHHDESHDVGGDVGHCQQIRFGQGGVIPGFYAKIEYSSYA